jgi:diguanylate cyclase (GGDEF)-like protein
LSTCASTIMPGNRARTPSLRLDTALQMISHAGMEAPAGEPGTTAWLQGLIDALCELSSRDPLTGIANRRSFELALAGEIDRVARAGEAALVLVIDIDHFKAINDTHGHAAGDCVLQSVARALAASVRPMDTVARLGGEEFAVLLPNCPPSFGNAVAERVRRGIERTVTRIASGQEIVCSASIGGAFAPQWVRSTPSLWIERADRQLYSAKAGGRNRICIEQPPASEVSAAEKSLLFGTSQFLDEN